MLLRVGGDGSFLALVDTSRYSPYVGEEWYESLHEHLAAAGARQEVIAWGTGFESDWLIEISGGLSSRVGFREFSSTFANAAGDSYLVNYDSLTMAAQFEDHALPDRETLGYKVPLPTGQLQVRVVQMFDPRTEWWESLGDAPAFLIEWSTTPTNSGTESPVNWWE